MYPFFLLYTYIQVTEELPLELPIFFWNAHYWFAGSPETNVDLQAINKFDIYIYENNKYVYVYIYVYIYIRSPHVKLYMWMYIYSRFTYQQMCSIVFVGTPKHPIIDFPFQDVTSGVIENYIFTNIYIYTYIYIYMYFIFLPVFSHSLETCSQFYLLPSQWIHFDSRDEWGGYSTRYIHTCIYTF